MKINKSDLKQIIKEEAYRLFQIEKLEEAKKAVDKEIKLMSKGKGSMTEQEMEELFSGLGSVLRAGAKGVKNALGSASQQAQQIGQNIANTYKQGENQAKIASLTKQQAELTAKLNSVNAELSKLSPPPAPAQAKSASPAKPAKPASSAKPAAKPAKPAAQAPAQKVRAAK